MSVSLVLNELSCTPVQTRQSAREMMDVLIATLIAARKHGLTAVRTHQDIHYCDLSPDYNIAKWRNDGEVEKDKRMYFKSLTSKFPYLEGNPLAEAKSKGIDCRFDGRQALGFTAAILLDEIAISLTSDTAWDKAEVNVQLEVLSDISKIETDSVFINHVSTPTHVEFHNDWINRRLRGNIRDGADLVKSRTTINSIIFCDSAFDHIKDLSSSDPKLRQFLKKIWKLSDSVSAGKFSMNAFPFKMSKESEATMQQFTRERTFLCPDGQNRIFEWHFRLTPEAWRCHFIFDENTNLITIGYIGPHLPVATEN